MWQTTCLKINFIDEILVQAAEEHQNIHNEQLYTFNSQGRGIQSTFSGKMSAETASLQFQSCRQYENQKNTSKVLLTLH